MTEQRINRLEDGPLNMLVGDYLNNVNQHRKANPLWMALFPGWDPGLYKYRKGAEWQYGLDSVS